MTGTIWMGQDVTAAGRAPTAADPTSAPAPRRRRVVVPAVLGAVVLAVLFVSWGGKPAASTAAYDPDNPTFNGAQALAQVLAGHGLPVVVARGEDELRGARVDGDTTVLVTATSELREVSIATMASIAKPAQRLVLVRPERRVVRQLAPTVAMRDVARQGEALVSGCDTADVRPGERLSRSQSEYQHPGTGGGCFVTDGYAVHLTLPASATVPPLLLLGSTDLVTNDRVASEDNGAVMIRALGHGSRVVWYLPDLRDLPPSATDARDRLWPEWLGSMILLTGFALAAVFWWRGRRLGRLVVEPLPVVIRAIETTESRGRLYRRARDVDRAAAVLRQATGRRLRAGLGLPPTASDTIVAGAVSAATGRPLEWVGAQLAGPAPAHDGDLLALAAALSALEKEIRPT